MFPPMRSFAINAIDTSIRQGMRSQTFDWLTPQPFGRDRPFDDVSFNQMVFCELHGHVKQGMRSQTFDLLTPQPFGRDGTFDGVSSDEIIRNFFSDLTRSFNMGLFSGSHVEQNQEPPLHCIQEVHPRSRERYRTSRDKQSPIHHLHFEVNHYRKVCCQALQ